MLHGNFIFPKGILIFPKGINLPNGLRCADEDFIDNIGGERLPSKYCVLHIKH